TLEARPVDSPKCRSARGTYEARSIARVAVPSQRNRSNLQRLSSQIRPRSGKLDARFASRGHGRCCFPSFAEFHHVHHLPPHSPPHLPPRLPHHSPLRHFRHKVFASIGFAAQTASQFKVAANRPKQEWR